MYKTYIPLRMEYCIQAWSLYLAGSRTVWTSSGKDMDITRNSSGDEIANVNFLYDDFVHVLQNTIDSCINSATDRRG